jgi:hypothetical protein
VAAVVQAADQGRGLAAVRAAVHTVAALVVLAQQVKEMLAVMELLLPLAAAAVRVLLEATE